MPSLKVLTLIANPVVSLKNYRKTFIKQCVCILLKYKFSGILTSSIICSILLQKHLTHLDEWPVFTKERNQVEKEENS